VSYTIKRAREEAYLLRRFNIHLDEIPVGFCPIQSVFVFIILECSHFIVALKYLHLLDKK